MDVWQVLMTNASFSIPAPLFVTWVQCLVTCLLCQLCGHLGDRSRKRGSLGSFFNQFPGMHYNTSAAAKIIPLSTVSSVSGSPN